MALFQQLIEFLRNNWAVLKSAPAVFITFAALAGFGGYLASTWYYGGILASKDAVIAQKDAQIARYRVALGIDKASQRALVELSNTEMRAKATATSTKLRDMRRALDREDQHIEDLKRSGKLDDKAAAERIRAATREASEQFERTLRADAINVDNELRRRLGPKAVGSIIGLPPSFYSRSDGSPIGSYAFLPSGMGMSAVVLNVLADGIDQMAALLSADAK